MKRLLLSSAVFIIWSILFAIVFAGNITLQVLMMLGLILLVIIFLGWEILLSQLRIIAPFIGMLLVVYSVFIFLGIDPSGQGAFEYWSDYGIPRILLLINAILAFRICFALVSVDELLKSGASIHQLKYILLAKILYDAATKSYHQMKEWQELMPLARGRKAGWRERFKRALSATLALVLYILAEAELKGERIDNLIATCYDKQSPKFKRK